MERPRGDERAGAQAAEGAVRWCRVEGSSVKPLLRAVGRPRVAWADATTTAVAGGAAATVTADGADRFEHVRERAEAVFAGLAVPVDLPAAARPRLYGGFAFHEGHTDPGPGATWHGYPGALFTLPAVQLSLADGHGWLTVAATGPDAGERAAGCGRQPAHPLARGLAPAGDRRDRQRAPRGPPEGRACPVPGGRSGG